MQEVCVVMIKKSKKRLEMMILEIVKRYKLILCRHIKNGLNLNNEGFLFDPNSKYNTFWKISSENHYSDEQREILRINFILSSLTKKENEIIWKEFFFVEDKFWWMSKYNRSTFYRLRAKAIDNFCSLI